MAKAAQAAKVKKKNLPTKARARAAAREEVLEDEHLMNFPALKTPTQVTSRSKKGSHFTDYEDVKLCQAFVAESTSPTKGANRKGNEFWESVTSTTYDLMAAEGNRVSTFDRHEPKSLKIRFNKTLSKQVNLFIGCYQEALQKKKTGEESGWNPKMFDEYALKLWLKQYKTPFPHLECARVLFKNPKYDPNVSTPKKGEKGTTATGDPMGAGMERPIGKKSATAAFGKNKGKSSREVAVAPDLSAFLENQTAVRASVRRMETRDQLMSEFKMAVALDDDDKLESY